MASDNGHAGELAYRAAQIWRNRHRRGVHEREAADALAEFLWMHDGSIPERGRWQDEDDFSRSAYRDMAHAVLDLFAPALMGEE